MKKVIFILSSVMALMLLSFAPPQEKQVVRLENGNYLLNELKMEREDLETIQKLINKMSESFSENEKNKKDDGRTKYNDLMNIFEQKEGFRQYIGAGIEDNFTVIGVEVYENVVSKTAYHEREEKKELTSSFRKEIGAIMDSYLETKK